MARITWYGHASFKFDIAGKALIVDPMLDDNPNSPITASEITEADVVYVTHDHSDHLGDSFKICQRTGALFAAVIELAEYASMNGVQNIAKLNIGGSLSLDGLKLTIVQAFHSANRGVPTGVIIQGEGLTIYHAGDTALFGDMQLFGRKRRIDLACLPVGGNYTMDAEEAVEAVKLLKPKMVFPMHFGTFPVLAKNATEFIEKTRLTMPEVRVLSLKPGEPFELAPLEVAVNA